MTAIDWILFPALFALPLAALYLLATRARPREEAAEQLSEDERRARLAPLAAGISLLAPGLGHLLIGARARALLWLTGWIVLAIVSGAVHGPVVVVLMVAAAIDAYLYARPRLSDVPTGSATHGRNAG